MNRSAERSRDGERRKRAGLVGRRVQQLRRSSRRVPPRHRRRAAAVGLERRQRVAHHALDVGLVHRVDDADEAAAELQLDERAATAMSRGGGARPESVSDVTVSRYARLASRRGRRVRTNGWPRRSSRVIDAGNGWFRRRHGARPWACVQLPERRGLLCQDPGRAHVGHACAGSVLAMAGVDRRGRAAGGKAAMRETGLEALNAPGAALMQSSL